MAEQIENTVTVNHCPIHPYRWRADQYRITITLSRNYESDPLPMRGCTLEEPWTDEDKRFLAERGLASNWNPDPVKRLAEAHRGQLLFHPDMAAIRAHLRAVCGVRDEDLPNLTWATILRTIHKNEPDASVAMEPPGTQRSEIGHSADYHSVRWYGERHTFSHQQAAVVALLWEAYENGTPNLSQEHLLDKSGSSGSRLRDVFRENGAMNAAWNTMIVESRRGVFHLSDGGKKS